jgi:hypothetical protein
MKLGPAIISIVGSHANEGVEDIFTRKRADIREVGHTIWLYHSRLASVDAVQKFCEPHGEIAVIFLKGIAKATFNSASASVFSADKDRLATVSTRVRLGNR